jgi:hypothetical protein
VFEVDAQRLGKPHLGATLHSSGLELRFHGLQIELTRNVIKIQAAIVARAKPDKDGRRYVAARFQRASDGSILLPVADVADNMRPQSRPLQEEGPFKS